MMVINKENIEEYLLLLIDGELSAADEMEVMTFIESHKEYQLLLDQYLETKLENEDIVFEDKASLLKPEENIIVFKNNKPKVFAWAAAVAAVIAVGATFQLMHTNRVESTTAIAKKIESKVHSIDSVPKQAIVAVIPKEVPKTKTAQTVVQKHTKVSNNVAQQVVVSNGYPILSYPEADKLKPLPVEEFKPLKADADRSANIASLQLPKNEMEATEPVKESNGLPDASRLEGLNALLSQVEILKDKIEDKTKVLKNMTVAIRLGGKEFTIGKQN